MKRGTASERTRVRLDPVLPALILTIAFLAAGCAERSFEALRPDMLQLHGNEPPERVAVVRSKFGLPVMKALPIAERRDLSPIRIYAKVADRIIFDARAPQEATRPGGLGKPFDWTLLKGINPGVPFMLSGGLDASNVAEAIRITGAPGVDVSSGVERVPGVKDLDKIRAFIHAARATNILDLGATDVVQSA